MNYVGIDIGSTAAKVVTRGDVNLEFVLPTGWSSKETAGIIRERLLLEGIDVLDDGTQTVATGYGRVAVDYADHVITEITCHARGGREIGSGDCSRDRCGRTGYKGNPDQSGHGAGFSYE